MFEDEMFGIYLEPDDQELVLLAYKQRYTGDWTPEWAKVSVREDGTPYPIHFRNDREWLSNTTFRINKNGRLRRKGPFCYEFPTWPTGEKDLPPEYNPHGYIHPRNHVIEKGIEYMRKFRQDIMDNLPLKYLDKPFGGKATFFEFQQIL